MINWSQLPSLSALRAFCAYVQTGSVTEAGAALNVSHAAISQQLRGLDAHIGTPLFDRSHRALELTRTNACDVEYWQTFDPSLTEGTRDMRIDAYRRVRDQLYERILKRFHITGGPEV